MKILLILLSFLLLTFTTHATNCHKKGGHSHDELTTNVPKTIPQSITQEARISNALKRQVKRAQAIANIYKDEIKPKNAFLELVKIAANPMDIKNIKEKYFFKIGFDFSRTNAKQNGQIKLNQAPA